MINSYALHEIADSDITCFSPEDYSRFKFGDDSVACRFGSSLAAGFISDYLSAHPIAGQIVVIPSPYSHIPTATFAMKNHFVTALNKWLQENGMLPVQEAKVSRTITYRDDYGALNAEERMRLIGNDRFQIDKELLEGKALLFLDDIRITGSHERMIRKMINEYQLGNEVHMLYFAELTNDQIHPRIENYLNYYYVKSVADIDNIIKSGNFKFNTRVIKYILDSDFSTCAIFLQNQTDEFIDDLYNLAVGNGYHEIDAYRGNLNYIKEFILTNNFNVISHGN